MVMQVIYVLRQTRESVSSPEISKHREESYKNDSHRSVFDEIWGVWIADETLSRVFDISSQSKQNLRNKRRCKIVKIFAK